MKRNRRRRDDGADARGQFRGFERSVNQVAALVLVVVILHFLVYRAQVASPFLFIAVVAVYTAVLLALRFAGLLRRTPRARIFVASIAMVLLTTFAAALGGAAADSLRYILLLPVAASALTLQGAGTILVLALVVAARVFLGFLDGAFAAPPAEYVATMVTELVPGFLIALLAWEVATGMQRARDRMRMLADSDDLTRLANMRAFSRVVRAELESMAQRNGSFSVLMIDVDSLRSINDEYGHDEGDRALVTVAEVLQRSVRGGDLVARYAGDEFAVYLAGANSEVAQTVANRIRHNVFATSHAIGHDMRRITVSVGVAVYPDDGDSAEKLLGKADKAMYEDKEMRRAPDEQSTDTLPPSQS
jgi:diguanylate cyclase (GGDEF)-like protein